MQWQWSMGALATVCALAGAAVTFAFGGWTEALTVLLVAMGVDYITGVAAALRQKQGLSSNIGFWGLARKGLTLLVLLLAHRLDVLLGTGDMALGGATYFYLANELISVAENYGRLGLPFPERLRVLIAALKDRKKDGE